MPPVVQTRGQFRASVWNSLENDPRFESLLNEACTRAVQEVFCQSRFGNFKHITDSENGREEYNLPKGTLFCNFVTYDSQKMERMTFDQWLNAKSSLAGLSVQSGIWPEGFLVKDNRDLILWPIPKDNGKQIAAYLTVSDDGFTDNNKDQEMPIAIAYTRGAMHYAKSFLLEMDGQEDRAEYYQRRAEVEIGKANLLLNGNVDTYVKRAY